MALDKSSDFYFLAHKRDICATNCGSVTYTFPIPILSVENYKSLTGNPGVLHETREHSLRAGLNQSQDLALELFCRFVFPVVLIDHINELIERLLNG